MGVVRDSKRYEPSIVFRNTICMILICRTSCHHSNPISILSVNGRGCAYYLPFRKVPYALYVREYWLFRDFHSLLCLME